MQSKNRYIVYKFTNISNNRVYYGSNNHPIGRFYEHILSKDDDEFHNDLRNDITKFTYEELGEYSNRREAYYYEYRYIVEAWKRGEELYNKTTLLERYKSSDEK